MERKIIETEIWEHPKKNSFLRKPRKVCDVFKELEASMKENEMMPDEYFNLDYHFDENSLIPYDDSFVAYATWGWGYRKGICLNVEMISIDGKKTLFASGKTLGETEEDYDRMQAIAGFIYKSFAGFGRVASEEKVEEKTYVVCIDESYLRDTQYFNSESLSDEEFEESENGLDVENCWVDVGLNAFVDIVTAASSEEARQKAANKWNYDARTMFATEIRKKK